MPVDLYVASVDSPAKPGRVLPAVRLTVEWLLLVLILATAASAQDHEFMKRGATRESLTSIDSVSLRNGNGVINIPIGPRVKVGGQLSFGLNLIYNSKIWDVEAGSPWTASPMASYPISLPSRKSNAGVGWTLSLGRLFAPDTPDFNETDQWMYVGPDGSEHFLYQTLREGMASDLSSWYSRDGSYLRMTISTEGYEVEFPSGEIHIFDGRLLLVKITDRYPEPNYLDVAYSVDELTVTITDRHDREWELQYEDVGTPLTVRTLDKVQVPAFGGASATYDFDYDEDRPVKAGCHVTDPVERTMPLLTAIDFPEGLRYEFSYYDDEPEDMSSCRQAVLRETRLPTGGRIVWDHDRFDIPEHCPGNSGRDYYFFWNRTQAVISREYFDIDGRSLARWQYSYATSAPGDGENLKGTSFECDDPGDSQHREALMATVRNPIGDKTVHFFMIWPFAAASEEGANLDHYNMPYVLPGIEEASIFPDDIDYQDGEGRFLSQLTYNCQPGVATCDQLFSARYVEYETEFRDWREELERSGPGTSDRLDRLISEKTVYFSPSTEAPQEIVTNYTDFDGLGHFRQTTTHTTFDNEPKYGRFRAYGPPGQGGYWMPEEDKPWVLDIYAYEDLMQGAQGNFTQDAQRSRTEYVFEPGTGFLQRQRVWAKKGDLGSLTRLPYDIVTEYERSESGDLIASSTFGGGRQNNLGSASLANLSLGDSWEYRTERIYEHGVLMKETERGSESSTLMLVTQDFDLDFNTGLPTASRDATGIETGFEYDQLGRLIKVNPEADARFEATWTNADWSDPEESGRERVEVQRINTNEHVLTREVAVRDGFGRNVLEQEMLPGGHWTGQRYEYGGNGLLHRISTPHEPENENPGWTIFSNYDPMARPLLTTMPDESEVRLAIGRETRFNTFYRVATSLTGEEPLTELKRVQVKDSRGRLVRVEELSDGEEESVHTDYTYDLAGRLVLVETEYPGGTQERKFEYDNRGFLLSEQHPEKGLLGNGVVTYTGYDTRGTAALMIDGSHRLESIFDDLGRPVQIWDGALGKLMVERFYSAENLSTPEGEVDRALGQLVQEKRHNYLDGSGEHVVITESYEYADDQGRLSRRRTRSNTGFDVVQDFTYDALGNLTTYGYPRQDLLPGQLDPHRETRLSWQNGRITGLDSRRVGPDWHPVISEMSYNTQGLVERRRHVNGVDDWFVSSFSDLPRPRRIYTEGEASGRDWNSGLYEYDSSGNIRAIGSDVFAYDPVDRLVESVVAGHHQTFAYDRFGNFNLSIDLDTNRELGWPPRYDDAGNKIRLNTTSPTPPLRYDVFNRLTSRTESSQQQRYVYGPGHERIATLESNGLELWTVRDPGNRVVREYSRAPGGSSWRVTRDYLYADQLVASVHEAPVTGMQHYHLDHLGSTRLVTDGNGVKVSGHTYLPFGEEIPDEDNPIPDGVRLKFTGHERDAADQDYMHARFYGIESGRFWSVDPVLGMPELPQSWNRYVYARNNPIRLVDPDGRFPGARALGEMIRSYVDRATQAIVIGHSQYQAVDPARTAINADGSQIARTATDINNGQVPDDFRDKPQVKTNKAIANSKVVVTTADPSPGSSKSNFFRSEVNTAVNSKGTSIVDVSRVSGVARINVGVQVVSGLLNISKMKAFREEFVADFGHEPSLAAGLFFLAFGVQPKPNDA